MIELRPITAEDAAEIRNWPPYSGGFAQMDYALREHGWLDEFMSKPKTVIYIAGLNKQIIGFSLLSVTAEGEAEFRIAFHTPFVLSRPYFEGSFTAASESLAVGDESTSGISSPATHSRTSV